jgi:hypothetical protein
VLGPRSRRTPNQTRRERRRIVFGIVIVAIVALVLGEVIDGIVKSSPGAQRHADATWVAAASAVIAQSNIESAELHEIRSRAPTLFNRVTLEIALTELEREAKTTEGVYARLGLGAPSASIGALMRSVLEDRVEGFRKLALGIDAAIATPSDVAIAAPELSSAGARFEAADRAYRSLTQLVRARGDDAAMPSSYWIRTGSNWSRAASSSFAGSLSRSRTLAASPALAIVDLSIAPPPLRINGLPASTTTIPASTTTSSTSTTSTTSPPGSTSTTSTTTSTTTTTTTLPAPTTTLQIPPSNAVAVIAATKKIRVAVVVEDTGNTWVRGADVSAFLVPAANRAARSREGQSEARLPLLSPDSSVYVTLRGLRVSRTGTYLLLVTAKLKSGRAVRRSVTIDFSS